MDEVFINESGAGYANQSRMTQNRKDYFYKGSNSMTG